MVVVTTPFVPNVGSGSPAAPQATEDTNINTTPSRNDATRMAPSFRLVRDIAQPL